MYQLFRKQLGLIFVFLFFMLLFFLCSAVKVKAEDLVAESSTFMDVVLPILLTTASTLVVLIVGWGLKLLSAYIASKTKNENLIVAFDTLAEIVDTTVKKLDQKFKAAAADGKLTQEEKLDLKKQALETVDKQLPEFIKNQLGSAVMDLQSYVDDKIEATVRDMKKGSG